MKCRGLVSWVPWAASYDLKLCIRLVPTSSKRLRKHTPHTEYGSTTPDWRLGTTNLKRTKPGSKTMLTHPPITVVVADRISTPISLFCLSLQPRIVQAPSHIARGEGGGLLASGMLYRCQDLEKRHHLIAMISLTMDKTTCTHTLLTAGTQVVKLIPSSPDIATLLKEHA
jgi:hypothetical protein